MPCGGPSRRDAPVADKRRALPSIDRLLRLHAVSALVATHGREPVVHAARQAVAAARDSNGDAPVTDAQWAGAVSDALEIASRASLQRCINATGVVVHTNLGRAPLADAAIDAVRQAAAGYSSLEYDVRQGARGDRHVHCAELLARLTGADDALVVNNAASALLLSIAVAATDGHVIVSRGELIEIGGGFRIPEIMELSGARLAEVGTTNRTRLQDYAKALQRTSVRADKRTRGRARTLVRSSAGTLLKVHRSNFQMSGFTAEASLEELVALGRKHRVPVLYDLGSGLMVDPDRAGLSGEPTLPAAARTGVHAVIASGDKLLGGPQAGIIAGRRTFVAACRRHPFARAARADKLTLAALSATLQLYQAPDRAWREIPVLRMLAAPVAELAARAERLVASLPPACHASVIPTRAAVGGGSFPGVTLESRGVALAPGGIGAGEFAARLRRSRVPVIATVSGGRTVLDVRALLPADDEPVITAVREALA